MCVCVCVCVRVCVRVCARARVRACVCARARVREFVYVRGRGRENACARETKREQHNTRCVYVSLSAQRKAPPPQIFLAKWNAPPDCLRALEGNPLWLSPS